MSLNHPPQSLPSFAQAFSTSSLSSIPSSNNALPPIQRTNQTISPPLSSRQPSVDQLRNSRKRSREEVIARADSNSDSGRQSPRVLRIKEEDDLDDPRIESQSPPPIPPTIIPPSPKKRRVTVSGTIHPPPPNSAPSSSDTSHSTPITPVVITIPTAEDPSREQLRSIQALKQQPKSLIEQRRGSFAGPPGPTTMLSPAINNGTSSSSATYSPPEPPLQSSKLSTLPRLGRRSPNTAPRTGAARATVASQPLTPPPMIVPSQQSLSTSDAPQQSPPSNSLPPPPISFARRRAAQSGGRKRKPADIVISPRGPHSSDPLVPVIQSAPPVPEFGRFPMALPRLPTALSGNQTARRVATNVPPTPTRFGLQHTIGPTAPRTATSTRSPPAIPIANSLVPPTPRSLQHPGYSGDKSAFLAPFEVFYDALNDSKQMKNWLSEQLQKSNALLQSLQKVDQVVEDLVEKRTRSMQEEMQSMRQRMDSLEEALRAVRADSARNQSAGYPQGSKFPQNGMSSGSEPSSSYRFPTANEPRRRVSPPSWGTDKDRAASRSPDPDRRMSVSVARLEAPPRLISGDIQSQAPYSPFAATSGRSGPVPASNPKRTPPLRSQPVPERTSTRQADARPPNRMYYSGSYNCGSGESSRSSDSHKNSGAMEER